jgi:hypothetical protein
MLSFLMILGLPCMLHYRFAIRQQQVTIITPLLPMVIQPITDISVQKMKGLIRFFSASTQPEFCHGE